MTDEPKGPPKIDVQKVLDDAGGGADVEEVEVLEAATPDEPRSRAEGPAPIDKKPAEPVRLEGSAEGHGEAALDERYLRLRADFENYRKRLEREKTEHQRLAEQRVVSDLLPVLDNLERALAGPSGETGESFREGIAMIHKQLCEALEDAGLTPYDSVGEPFDPEIHAAVARVDSAEFPPNTVLTEVLRGYRFRGRVLRPAMVNVTVCSEPEGTSHAVPDSGGEE